MKPAPFEYLAPDTLEETLSILQSHGSEAKLLAGGQSLVPAMNFRLVQPKMLVDLNRLSQLEYVHRDSKGKLSIGAMTRQRRLERDRLIGKWFPLISETMVHVAHPQIRNRGTIGGSLVHADPAAELPVITLALEARFKIRSALEERWVLAEDFFRGIFTTAMEPEEILVEVEISPTLTRTGWSFMEISRRQGDYALMGLAALVTLDVDGVCQSARLVYLNAGDGPLSARQAAGLLKGEALIEPVIEAAANMAAYHEIDPIGNVHASPSYQRHLAFVLTRRALRLAADRARQ